MHGFFYREHEGEIEAKTREIVIVGNDQATKNMLRDVLQQQEHLGVATWEKNETSLSLLEGHGADLAVLHVDEVEKDLEYTARLRARTDSLPVILVSAFANNFGRRALELGVDDVIYMPFRMEEFTFRLLRVLHYHELLLSRQKLFRENQQLWRQAITDPLTNLFNRKYFQDLVEKEVQRSSRYQTALSCIIFAIDGFEKINELHGHLVGDAMLREIGALLRDSIRKVDIAARYEGDTFALVLPETSHEGVKNLAERLCSELTQYPYTNPKTGDPLELGSLELIMGLSDMGSDGAVSSALQLFEKAVGAMHQARNTPNQQIIAAWDQEH